uniref:Uncharacterized protein n=1 Tax=Arundo donax TaxID=35708 RepID=A0A0A9TZK7_ARUDO
MCDGSTTPSTSLSIASYITLKALPLVPSLHLMPCRHRRFSFPSASASLRAPPASLLPRARPPPYAYPVVVITTSPPRDGATCWGRGQACSRDEHRKAAQRVDKPGHGRTDGGAQVIEAACRSVGRRCPCGPIRWQAQPSRMLGAPPPLVSPTTADALLLLHQLHHPLYAMDWSNEPNCM